MPAHYPHWSYGKSYEKTKTMYDHGVVGLPYELVINSNPCLAYLMRDNTLCLQILTIAHVYGHNDFFKNNFTFTSDARRADHRPVQGARRSHPRLLRGPLDRPGARREAARCRACAVDQLPPQPRDPQAQAGGAAPAPARGGCAAADPFARLHRPPEYIEPDLRKVPLEPDEDILLFIRDHNRHLQAWEQDVLTIVHEEAAYFLPQIETKIMNEGWASYWHHQIMNSLDLPQEIHMEFLVRHNQVVSPHPAGHQPLSFGLQGLARHRAALRRADPGRARGLRPPNKSGREKIFEVRETDRDASFLRRFLTEDLMRELDLFEFEPRGDNLVVTKVSGEDGWRDVKETLIRTVGMNAQPVIRIYDADYGNNRALYLKHEHDGRDLHIGYAEKTLGHLHQLWATGSCSRP